MAYCPRPSIYREFLQANPRHPQALQFLGVLAAQTGNLSAANKLILQAIRQQPDFADARYSLGHVFLAQGRKGEAVTVYTQALALDHPCAGDSLASLLDVLGVSERARFERLLAELLLTRGQIGAALDHTQRAIRLDPDGRQNWAPLGRCLTFVKFKARVPGETLALLL